MINLIKLTQYFIAILIYYIYINFYYFFFKKKKKPIKIEKNSCFNIK